MKIPYVKKKKLANGEVAYYTFIPPHLIPKGCDIKSSQPLGKDEVAAYSQALEIYKTLKEFRNNKKIINQKTIAYLWEIYQQSRFWIELAERTQKDYTRAYTLICRRKNKSGQSLNETPLDLFDYDSAYKLFERLEEDVKTHWARNCIFLLRMLYNFGLKKEIFLKKNPFENMRIKKPKPKKESIPKEHIVEIINKAREISLDAVALGVELNYYLCQRPADLLKLRKTDIYQKGDNYFFNIIQNKTKAIIKAPIPPHLLPDILDKEDFIISDNKTKQYSVVAFQRLFKRVNQILGYNYVFRLMRHSGSTAYAEAGINTSAIIAITGHTNEGTFNRIYKSNTEGLGLYAMNGLLKAENKEKN